MSIAEVIKKKEKKRKKTPDKPSFFESPLWKRVEEHAKDWDNRHTKEFTEKYRHLTQKKEEEKKQPEVEGPMEGVENKEATLPSKPDKRAPKRKQKAEKPKSEFLEKYYGKDWA